MAKYTIELREVVNIKGLIFNFHYDFYGTDEQRLQFEEKFIRHFYFREIGFETIDRFLFELQDKFLTVFPFYNKLFETAQIEYTVTENYDMKEATTITKETTGKTSGVSSTVGQSFDNQETTTDENRTTDTTGNVSATGKNTLNETGETETDKTGTSETVGTGTSETVGTGTSETSTTETSSKEFDGLSVHSGESSVSGNSDSSERDTITKKFLDTPQGAIDLDDINYLTTLNKDTGNKDTESSHVDTTVTLNNDTTENAETGSRDSSSETETTDNSKTTTGSNSETESEENTQTTSERDVIENLSSNADSVSNETATGKTETSFTGEQKTTHDNNTRTKSEGFETETIEHYRHGNIGVQTATDMLEKHIDLQRKLTKIEKMFFDECEDLFMQIF